MAHVSRRWVYTINNYTDHHIQILEDLDAFRHVCGIEEGDSGTIHLQGAVTLKQSMRFTQLHGLIPEAHWEIMAGTVDQAMDYAAKGGVLVIDNRGAGQGHRSDLTQAIDTLQEHGMRRVAEEHPETYVRFHRGLEALRAIRDVGEADYDTSVIVLVGAPGTGKSRRCREFDPELYSVPMTQGGTLWWDNYLGEKTILFDDFSGWVPYQNMLGICDRYPMQVPIKGGMVRRQWHTVLITSNTWPRDWWPKREEIAAFERRITHMYEYTMGEPIVIKEPAGAPVASVTVIDE